MFLNEAIQLFYEKALHNSQGYHVNKKIEVFFRKNALSKFVFKMFFRLCLGHDLCRCMCLYLPPYCHGHSKQTAVSH